MASTATNSGSHDASFSSKETTISRLCNLSDDYLKKYHSSSCLEQNNDSFSLMQMSMVHEAMLDSMDAFSTTDIYADLLCYAYDHREVDFISSLAKPHHAILIVAYLLRDWYKQQDDHTPTLENNPICHLVLPLLFQTQESHNDNFQTTILEIMFFKTPAKIVIEQTARYCVGYHESSFNEKKAELTCRVLAKLLSFGLKNVFQTSHNFILSIFSNATNYDSGEVRAATCILVPKLYQLCDDNLVDFLEKVLFKELLNTNSIEDLNARFGILSMLYCQCPSEVAEYISSPYIQNIVLSKIRWVLNQSSKNERDFNAATHGSKDLITFETDLKVPSVTICRKSAHHSENSISSGDNPKMNSVTMCHERNVESFGMGLRLSDERTIVKKLMENGAAVNKGSISDGDFIKKTTKDPLVIHVVEPQTQGGNNNEFEKINVKYQANNIEEGKLDNVRLLRKRALNILHQMVVHSGDENKIWKVYINCMKALDMEQEQNTIEHTWECVEEFCDAVVVHTDSSSSFISGVGLPPPDEDFFTAIWCRLFYAEAPILRKLGLCRFLNPSMRAIWDTVLPALLPGMLQSYDSLVSTEGDHFQSYKKDFTLLLRDFTEHYLLLHGNSKHSSNKTKLETLLDYDKCLGLLKPSAVALILEGIRRACVPRDNSQKTHKLQISKVCLENAIFSLANMGIGTTGGGMLPNLRWSILNDFASLLRYGNLIADTTLDADMILKLLGLYYPLHLVLDEKITLFNTFESLECFFQRKFEWVKKVVVPECHSFISCDKFSQGSTERTKGSSIVYLCRLGLGKKGSEEMLWSIIRQYFVVSKGDAMHMKRVWILLCCAYQNDIFDKSTMNGLDDFDEVLEGACLYFEQELDTILQETEEEKSVVALSPNSQANNVFDRFSLLLKELTTLYNVFDNAPSDNTSESTPSSIAIATLANKLKLVVKNLHSLNQVDKIP